MTKTNHIHVRVTEKDYHQIRAKADQARVNISEFVRCAVTDQQLPPSLTDLATYELLIEIKTELNRIGVYLNQIAKACKTSVQLGSPVVVDPRLLEANQRLIKQATLEVETTVKTLVKAA